MHLIREMPWWYYTTRPTNLAFHDLTLGKVMPQATASLLGLNLKFIPKPEHTTSSLDLLKTTERLERDLHRKIYFAGAEEKKEDQDKEKSKLYLPSDWRPDSLQVPRFIDDRIAKFAKALGMAFKRKKVPSNLLPFQQTILDSLRQNHGIVIANSDKGLGPVAIELHRYIQDALIHLMDKNTYEILSEAEAMEAVESLRTQIRDWLREYEEVLNADEWLYIDHHLETNEDPYGYFYLLYKIAR